MTRKTSLFSVSIAAMLALGACSTAPKVDNGQYWQRASVSDAIYQTGPKAQQMLNRDISRCVTELRELEGLGSIRDAIPTDKTGKLLDPDEQKLTEWDSPERGGMLLAEHGDYTDFEGCMTEKGWERIKYVPYDVSEQSRRTWFKAHVDYGSDPRDAALRPPAREESPYND